MLNFSFCARIRLNESNGPSKRNDDHRQAAVQFQMDQKSFPYQKDKSIGLFITSRSLIYSRVAQMGYYYYYYHVYYETSAENSRNVTGARSIVDGRVFLRLCQIRWRLRKARSIFHFALIQSLVFDNTVYYYPPPTTPSPLNYTQNNNHHL